MSRIVQTGHAGEAENLHFEELNEQIRHSVGRLTVLGFNWDGQGGLPMREDVHMALVSYLFGTTHLGGPVIKQSGKLRVPSVKLHQNGTVEVCYVHGLKSLKLHVCCRGVFLTSRIYGDGQTRIDGRLAGDRRQDEKELRSLFDWLRGDEE